ncbi:hypothetical protein CAPN001_11660 [Capnocytophaga stomatis]|uniref:hypothetical protein n=1 Tax=Capnocytophaga stomatis TaxID=1848904 RepID=UPI00194DE6FA|nr:hypothetical protein [Capnocytophaga stomatis]GIJ96597.1 hypothetical protein CAPN001_11660 [Capnocytophaga stomatis]
MENPFKHIQSKKERIQLLKDNAVRAEEMTYSKQFTEEEISEKKDELAKQDIALMKLEEEKKQITADFNDKIKKIKSERDVNLHGIRTGVQEVTETVYLLDDQEERKMHIYNDNGDLILSRPLKQEERQLSILRHTGTEN